MPKPPFVKRLVVENFKSIRFADIEFGPLTYLVGPNASGKSNVLRALRFISDALRFTLPHSPSLTGRLTHVSMARRPAATFGLTVEFQINHRYCGMYRVEIREDATVVRETLSWVGPSGDAGNYDAINGEVGTKSHSIVPDGVTSGLVLSNLTGVPPFDDAFRAISGIRFYSPAPDAIRGILQSAASSELRENGGNVVDILAAMEGSPEKAKLIDYLRAVEPRIMDVERFADPRIEARTFLLTERNEQGEPGRRLAASEQSDGTLRTIANLAALFQLDRPARIRLVGLEEPEAQIHPAAAAVLRDAIDDASHSRQVIVTTHAAEILDDKDVDPSCIRAVEMVNGETVVSKLDPITAGVIRDRLYTAGELLRDGNLRPQLREEVPSGPH